MQERHFDQHEECGQVIQSHTTSCIYSLYDAMDLVVTSFVDIAAPADSSISREYLSEGLAFRWEGHKIF